MTKILFMIMFSILPETQAMFLHIRHVPARHTCLLPVYEQEELPGICVWEEEKAMESVIPTGKMPAGLIPADVVIRLMNFPANVAVNERIRRLLVAKWDWDEAAVEVLKVLDQYYRENRMQEYPKFLMNLYGDIEDQVDYKDKAYWAPALRIAILSRILDFWDIGSRDSQSTSCFFFVNRVGTFDKDTLKAYRKMFRDRLAEFKGDARSLDFWIFDPQTSPTVAEILCHARVKHGGVDLMKKELFFLSSGFHDLSDEAVSYLKAQMARVANAQSGFRAFRDKLFELIQQASDEVKSLLGFYDGLQMQFLLNDGDLRVEVLIKGDVLKDTDSAKFSAAEIVKVLEKYVHEMERKFKLCITLVDKDDDGKTAILFEQGLECPF